MTYAKGLTAASLVTLLIAFSGCGQTENKSNRSRTNNDSTLNPVDGGNGADAKGQKGSNDSDDQGDQTAKDDKAKTDDKKEDDQPLQKIQASIGLRNYDQINATMSVVTGVPASTANVKSVFDNITTSLPTDNDIKGFLGSQQVSVFKLAVEYCDALVKDTTKRAEFFPGFNFAGTPTAVLNAAGKQDIADALVTKVWGKDLDFLPVHSDSVASVVSLIDDILVGKNMNQAAVTSAVVTGACTAVLASAPAVMY